MNRRFRVFAALAAMVAFLFAQAVVSAYACAGPVDAVAKAQMKAAMGEDGGLCEKQCTTGTASFDIAKPAAASMPAVTPVALRVVAVAPAVRLPASRGAPLFVAGPAPPLIRFTVLRI